MRALVLSLTIFMTIHDKDPYERLLGDNVARQRFVGCRAQRLIVARCGAPGLAKIVMLPMITSVEQRSRYRRRHLRMCTHL